MASALTFCKDRSQFHSGLLSMAAISRALMSQVLLNQFWLWSMHSGLKNAYESKYGPPMWRISCRKVEFQWMIFTLWSTRCRP